MRSADSCRSPRLPAVFLAPTFSGGALAIVLLVTLSGSPVQAAPNFAPGQSQSWAPNLGWANWAPNATDGAELGQYVCSGFVYSANVGWINLGDGTPNDRVHYSNSSASDFGVNVDPAGNLRGFAYGANVGWIQFEDKGAPKIDLVTGRLSGYAYGANFGWLDLGGSDYSLAVQSVAAGADSDRDGIPDAWETLHAPDLATLDDLGDFDHDGQSDLQEYLADTDPIDPLDHLELRNVSVSADGASVTLSWTSKPTRQYIIESRNSLNANGQWADVGLGVQTATDVVTTRTAPASSAQEFFRIRAYRPLAGSN